MRATADVLEDNVVLKQRLGEAGEGRVLVVDGGGSVRCALLGDAVRRGPRSRMDGRASCSGAASAMSRRSANFRWGSRRSVQIRDGSARAAGEVDVPVTFGGVTFQPGATPYSDDDGIAVVG